MSRLLNALPTMFSFLLPLSYMNGKFLKMPRPSNFFQTFPRVLVCKQLKSPVLELCVFVTALMSFEDEASRLTYLTLHKVWNHKETGGGIKKFLPARLKFTAQHVISCLQCKDIKHKHCHRNLIQEKNVTLS